ncbi:MAG: hypothetical protein ACJAVI_001667 [Candidatus Azotimanducaceae bacterium]|jgi:hypothetical protein
MKLTNYILLCVVLAVTVSLAVLFVPGVAESIEIKLLTFLSTNAR